MESLEQCKIKALRRGVPSRKKQWEAVRRGVSTRGREIGIVAAGGFIWDLYTDSHHYMGNDFNKAATVSTIAFLTGIGVGLVFASAPTLVGITFGAIATTAIGSGANYLKKQWIGY